VIDGVTSTDAPAISFRKAMSCGSSSFDQGLAETGMPLPRRHAGDSAQ